MAISETESDDRRLSLIDVSSADDSLIANPFHHQHSENKNLLCTPNSRKFEDAASKLQEWEREPQPNEVENPKKNSKCNLRKSLAWDKAFFTSAGVLDPEELSSMIEGVEKGEKHALSLPGIQEDVHGSCEPISTLESDSLTLESLEADLFEDLRASIQKSSRMSNVASANRKVPSEFQTGGSSKKVGMASCNKAPSSKSLSACMQGTGMLTKKNPVFPQLPPKPVVRREEPSISKQPKVLGKSNPSSTILSKRASVGDVKSEKDKANQNRIIGGKVNSVTNTTVIKGSQNQIIGGKVNSVTNTTVIKGSHVNGPKPTISSKSTSGLSVATKTKSTISTSSSSSLSSNIGKSPLNSLKKKVDAGTKKPLSSCSGVRTPSRVASRDKIGSSNSSLSCLLSVTKLSSSISPASSISDWSSESSSSTYMAKYRSNCSRTSFDSSSSRKDLPEIDARQGSNSQNPRSDLCSEGKETRDTGFISQCVRTASSGMVLPPAPKKPSGLRRPSPKIGFFDGVKSSVRTPRGGMQPHTVVPHSLSKHGAASVSPSEGQNKSKLRKLQSARSIASIEYKEFNNQQTLHTSMALEHVESSSATPTEVQNKMHLKAGVGNMDANNTMAEGHLTDINFGSTQENSHYDDQVNCLSKQVGLIDINLKEQT